MPVPQQPGTATTVVSTGTKTRFGIEGQSVGASPTLSSSTPGDKLVNRAISAAATLRWRFDAEHIASAVPTPIISFAIFAAHA